MRDIIHDAWVVVRVIPSTVAGDEDDTEDSKARKLSVRVVQAHYGCTAGKEGGCHHICTLLQLIRLLGMT